MNHEDLLEAIGAADEAMLEQSEKKVNRKRNWLISTTAAVASFVLLFSIVWQSRGKMYFMVDHNIIDENIFWIDEPDYGLPDNFGGSGGIGGAGSVGSEPTYQFSIAKSVHTEIIEILPDVYCYPRSAQAYRILHLKVLETIVGQNMPSEIYYLMPAYLSTDLLEYDSFIMTVEQVGLENYVMLNATQKRAEAFTLLFCSAEFNTCFGSVLAFSDDKLDISLWDKDGWSLAKDEVVSWLLEGNYNEYPGKINRNSSDTKKAILESYEAMKDGYYGLRSDVITSDIFDWTEAKEALSHIASFGEGVFWHTAYYEQNYYSFGGQVHEVHVDYTRVINGFYTNEWVLIGMMTGFPNNPDSKSVIYSKEHFTEEDLKNLPNLAGFIENTATLCPPAQEEEIQLRLNKVSGEYIKYEDYVFGFVTCSWGYANDNGTQTAKSYYLIYPDNTYQETGIRGSMETTNGMKDWIAQH